MTAREILDEVNRKCEQFARDRAEMRVCHAGDTEGREAERERDARMRDADRDIPMMYMAAMATAMVEASEVLGRVLRQVREQAPS